VTSLSVILPALNEESYLGETLSRLGQAVRSLQAARPCPVQVIVVDNDSDDRTAEVARQLGATVVSESIRNVGRARNAGARAADGEVLLFLDADTLVPPCVLSRIAAVTDDPRCVGGAVDVDHRPSSAVIRLYLRLWRLLGRLTGMARGRPSSAGARRSSPWAGTTNRSSWVRTSISTGA
jgi:glycosyltransferase involved in cell wall biosynthesis